jgi:hypothetical protein
MDSRKRSACYPRGSFYPLSPVPPTRDPRITNTCFRICSTCTSRSQAGLPRLHDESRFPFGISRPLYASVTFLEATSPVKLPTRQCSSPGFLCRSKSDFLISKSGIPLLTEVSHLCSTVKIKSSVPSCSKAPRGLFVHVYVGRIFTAISISPGSSSRQSQSRSTFRAGRNLPDTLCYPPPLYWFGSVFLVPIKTLHVAMKIRLYLSLQYVGIWRVVVEDFRQRRIFPADCLHFSFVTGQKKTEYEKILRYSSI